MNYKYEEHLILYQKKENNLPTYSELCDYVKDVKEKAFKQGILIELFHHNVSEKDIYEIINSLTISSFELDSTNNDILKMYRHKEITLTFVVIQNFFNELVKNYKKLGMKYCKDSILCK